MVIFDERDHAAQRSRHFGHRFYLPVTGAIHLSDVNLHTVRVFFQLPVGGIESGFCLPERYYFESRFSEKQPLWGIVECL